MVLLKRPHQRYTPGVNRYTHSGTRLLAMLVLLGMSSGLLAAESPGHRALKRFSKGANWGNYLEAPRGQDWGASYSVRDLDAVKREGFDHVRLPIRWNDYTGPGPEFRIEPQLFSKVDFFVTNALDRGLSILINIHHFDDLTIDPQSQTAKFYELWRQIAEYYARQPEGLAFELLNEPRDAATTEVMNPIYAEAIRIIRKSNPNRVIFVGPGKWNSLDEVEKLKLPADPNLIVTVHSYEPFMFTHQGTRWTLPETATVGVIYPGPPPEPITPAKGVKNKEWFDRYNRLPAAENPCGPKAFAARMERVAKWASENNRPIHLGEFGAYVGADAESRARYYKDMRQTAERLGFGWAIWDWKAGFAYWDGEAPRPGMRTALFSRE